MSGMQRRRPGAHCALGWRACTASEEVEGKPSQGSSSASCPVCLGAVEVEANGPVLPVAAAATSCTMQRISSFNTCLQPSCGCWEVGCVQDPGCGAPARAS